MAFTKKEWKDRYVEFAGRRNLKNIQTNETITVDVTRNEGEVMQQGDNFSGTNMNDLEDRVSGAFESYHTQRNVLIPASGWSSAYPYTNTVSVEGITGNEVPKVAGVWVPTNATEAQVKAWNKAAGMLISNTAANAVGNGYITFKAYKKPAVDFTVIVEGG